jgi:diacylglycerol kinase (ATP)
MRRLLSFKYAFKGIIFLLRTQRNAWIHSVAAVTVILLAILLGFHPGEWLWITVAIGFVFSAELFNTAIEQLTDFVSPGYNEKAGRAKDLAAGAVLVAALTAAVIGVVILWPHFVA